MSDRVKAWLLAAAEGFDAWRVVPRLMLIAYGYLVWSLYSWYRAIPVYLQTKCEATVLETLLSRNVPINLAKEMACNVTATMGGPSSEQTMFVTTIIGLSTGIFALYTTTGRKWDGRGRGDDNDFGDDDFGDDDFGDDDRDYDRGKPSWHDNGKGGRRR